MLVGVLDTPPPVARIPPPLHTTMFPCIALVNHGARGRTPAYLWVIGMAVCGDKDMAALATIWAGNLKACGPFVVC